MTVPDAIRDFFATRCVSGRGVVAVSGGPDSVALLRGLVAAGCGPLTVAHVNHGLRGADADGDEEFVRELAATHNLGFRAARLPVPANENLEAAARRLRYEFLRSFDADWVATGHTADDQAETVLHRLIRGTGVQGLRGIAATKWADDLVWSPPPLGGRVRVGGKAEHPKDEPDRPSPTVVPPTLTLPPKGGGNKTVVRPLIHVSRADVLAYLASLNQPVRTDSTNTDRRFTRNRIRHDLLPRLKAFNPEIVAVLGRLAEQADDVFAHLEGEAAALLAHVERPPAGELLILDAALLEASPPVVVRELFRLLWRREEWPLDGLTHAHWRRVGSLQPADYPGGVRLQRVGRVVQLSRPS